MPIAWITGGTSSTTATVTVPLVQWWYIDQGTTATTGTWPVLRNWTTAPTGTTTTTAWPAHWWMDDHDNDATWTPWTPRPSIVRRINWRPISPTDLYIARRRSALADDLHDFYRMHERRQQAEVAKHQEQASARSRELLLQHLTPAQRETFERNKWFIVEGGKSRQRYRIRHAGHMVANIDVLAGEAVEHRLCGHCDLREVPLFDQLLAQKLMLEFDEERFLKLANRHRAA